VPSRTQRSRRLALDGGRSLHLAPIPQRSAAALEILVVDDDFSAREVLTELLQDHGYSVISAADGREALNYLRDASPPGIIILDLMMPVMDGWEFLEHQSHDPALLDIPVIVTSATPPLHPLRAKAVLQNPIQFESLWSRCWSDSYRPRFSKGLVGKLSIPRLLGFRPVPVPQSPSMRVVHRSDDGTVIDGPPARVS
jgi:CheY-like chemotaxis protein